jgi:methyl coenzyme M reductase subunit C-like uncharacterized protein (methanogenesis marker protein 7)
MQFVLKIKTKNSKVNIKPRALVFQELLKKGKQMTEKERIEKLKNKNAYELLELTDFMKDTEFYNFILKIAEPSESNYNELIKITEEVLRIFSHLFIFEYDNYIEDDNYIELKNYAKQRIVNITRSYMKFVTVSNELNDELNKEKINLIDKFKFFIKENTDTELLEKLKNMTGCESETIH